MSATCNERLRAIKKSHEENMRRCIQEKKGITEAAKQKLKTCEKETKRLSEIIEEATNTNAETKAVERSLTIKITQLEKRLNDAQNAQQRQTLSKGQQAVAKTVEQTTRRIQDKNGLKLRTQNRIADLTNEIASKRKQVRQLTEQAAAASDLAAQATAEASDRAAAQDAAAQDAATQDAATQDALNFSEDQTLSWESMYANNDSDEDPGESLGAIFAQQEQQEQQEQQQLQQQQEQQQLQQQTQLVEQLKLAVTQCKTQAENAISESMKRIGEQCKARQAQIKDELDAVEQQLVLQVQFARQQAQQAQQAQAAAREAARKQAEAEAARQQALEAEAARQQAQAEAKAARQQAEAARQQAREAEAKAAQSQGSWLGLAPKSGSQSWWDWFTSGDQDKYYPDKFHP